MPTFGVPKKLQKFVGILIDRFFFNSNYKLFTLHRPNKARVSQRKRDYDPIKWSGYFDSSEDVELGENTFHVYTKGTSGPTIVLLHGGGYGALTWAEFTVIFFSM